MSPANAANGIGKTRRATRPSRDWGFSAADREGAFLNIFSMRSVIRKPPTTFVEEQHTAMKPKIVLSNPWPDPATTSEPTSEIPDIAFVADIRGVCSRGGTREMT